MIVGIVEPSEFEPRQSSPGDDDTFYAFQMPYIWEHVLPTLKDIWKAEGMMGVIERKYKCASYPYTEKETMWAFAKFTDANGPVMKFEEGMFRKCSCVDNEGERKPCVPPLPGFMCQRICTKVKTKNVLYADRQQRIWTEYKNNNLKDAVQRAKEEAMDYLKSAEGKDWVTTCAYEHAQETLGGREENTALKWRQNLANRRKKRVIRRFERAKRTVIRRRDKRKKVMTDEIAKLMERMNDGTTFLYHRRLRLYDRFLYRQFIYHLCVPLYSYCISPSPSSQHSYLSILSPSTNNSPTIILSYQSFFPDVFFFCVVISSSSHHHFLIDENIVEGGFVRVMIEARMEDLTNRSKNMEEDVQVMTSLSLSPV